MCNLSVIVNAADLCNTGAAGRVSFSLFFANVASVFSGTPYPPSSQMSQ